MHKLHKNYSGFTLVELLVVIAIIALLTGIITANFAQSRSRARDSQRVSDLAQLQLALGLYFDRCGQYPTPSGNTLTDLTVHNGCPDPSETGGVQINLGSYIGKIPQDPNSISYIYKTNTGNSNYILHTTLENPNVSVQKNSLQGDATVTLNETCYNNTPTSKDYCLGPK